MRRDEGSFIWENEFDEESDLNQYDLTLFIRDEEDEDIYFKYEEQHVQRAYEIDNVCKLIKEAGMAPKAESKSSDEVRTIFVEDLS